MIREATNREPFEPEPTPTRPPAVQWSAARLDHAHQLRQGTPLVDTCKLRHSISYRVDGDRVIVGPNPEQDFHQFCAALIAQVAATLGIPAPLLDPPPRD